MLYRELIRIVGNFLVSFALILLVPLFVSIYYDYFVQDSVRSGWNSSWSFFLTALITFLFGSGCILFGKRSDGIIYRKEALASVVLIWFLTPAISAMPFLMTEVLKNPFQAYFETSSALTTTGASILFPQKIDPRTGKEMPYDDVEEGSIDTYYHYFGTIKPKVQNGELLQSLNAIPKPLLFWRSFMQWLGGVGIVVLFVAVLPIFGVGGKVLFHTEAPGPIKEGLTPRIKESAFFLWKIYLGLTVLQIIVLMIVNPALPLFDSVCITFSTLSTGGLSVVDGSIGAYHNSSTDWVVCFFMLIGGMNFSLFYFILKGKFKRLWDLEFIVYLLVILICTLFVTFCLLGTPRTNEMGSPLGAYTWEGALKDSIFHVVSAVTSTGFFTTDFDKWPMASQVLLFILMYIGGMSGSTSGGIKMIRPIMIFRILQNKIESIFRPQIVRSFRIGKKEVDIGVIEMVLCFFALVIAFSVIGVFLLVVDGVDPETSLTTVAATINNAGFAFREAGPLKSFAFLSDFGLILTSILMIMGRLEFFALLVLLFPSFWKKYS